MLLLDEVDKMLDRLIENNADKNNSGSNYITTIPNAEKWNSWLDKLNKISKKKPIILLCTTNLTLEEMDRKYGAMVREGRFNYRVDLH